MKKNILMKEEEVNKIVAIYSYLWYFIESEVEI